jgi:hypothetical protein
MTINWKHVRCGAAGLMVLGLLLILLGCGGKKADSEAGRKNCVYAVVQAYPTWNVKSGSITESLTECKLLPSDDRARIRKQLSALVDAANANDRQH